MKNLSSIVLLLLFSLCSGIPLPIKAQSIESITQSWFAQLAPQYQLQASDIGDWKITAQHISRTSGVHHIYTSQTFNGIEVAEARWSLHLSPSGELLVDHQNFVPNLKAKIQHSKQSLSAQDLIQTQFQEALGFKAPSLKRQAPPKGEEQFQIWQIVDANDHAPLQILAKLVYQKTPRGDYALAWELHLPSIGDQDARALWVDAQSGEELAEYSLSLSCSFPCDHEHQTFSAPTPPFHQPGPSEQPSAKAVENAPQAMGTYSVYPLPLPNPYWGPQSDVINPADPLASPFGWHDLDGITGADTEVTQGNNVDAIFEEESAPDYRPNGGPSLNFSFPHDPNSTAVFTYMDASLTQLFYINNVTHDILFHYGFDEASGNLQQINYSGAGVGNDNFIVKGLFDIGCNANIDLTVEALPPRMNVRICNQPSNHDVAFSNQIIVHEYVHALTGRLIGGPNDISVFNNQEHMSEGWSDWYAMMFTMTAADQATDVKPFGNWLFDQGPNGNGVRSQPYSTDMAVNTVTYADLPFVGSLIHERGQMFCSMLWEMTWGLIDQYGFDPDLYYGTGGNNIALAIVTESLKMTPINPGFEDARDAILLADQALYGGNHACLIWRAFAKRGLGYSADQVDPSNRFDGIAAFDLPPQCECAPAFENKVVANDDQSGDEFGSAVALRGDLAMVAAPREDELGTDAGAVYLYQRSAPTGWQEIQKLTASDGASGDQFGYSVAMGRGVLAVGAPYDDDNGKNSGAVYLYQYNQLTNNYQLAQKITAWDAAANDNFGISVALDDRDLLVGANGDDDNGKSSGAAYTFNYSNGAWANGQKLGASDGGAGHRFGTAVAWSGANIVIGAPSHPQLGDKVGAAYVFHQSTPGGNFLEVDQLVPSFPDDYAQFGQSVAIDKTTVLVGAPQSTSLLSGRGYIYSQKPTTNAWPETQVITPPQLAPGDRFGWQVSLSDNRAVITARRNDDLGSSSGRLFLYEYFASYWNLLHEVYASDAAVGDEFGRSAILSEGDLLVGAPFNDDAGTDSGSAYFYGCTLYSQYLQAPSNEQLATTNAQPPLATTNSTLADLSVHYFPNPFTDKLTVTITGSSKQPIHFSLYDAKGQLVRKQQHQLLSKELQNFEFETDALATGVYYLQVQHGQERVLYKVFKP